MPIKDPIKRKEYHRQYYLSKSEIFKKEKREYYQDNREKILQQKQEYHKRPEVVVRCKKYKRRPEVAARRRELCKRLEYREKRKEYRHRDYVREKELKAIHEWRQKNKEHRKQYEIEYDQRPEVIERKRNYYAIYDRTPERIQKRRQRDTIRRHQPYRKLAIQLRVRIWAALRGKTKSAKTLELLGCNIKFLWNHLEEQFQSGMTRENYGSAWHVDHIIPCAWWNLFDSDHQKACFHWSNLQPLWGSENCSKGSRYSKINIDKLNDDRVISSK